MNKTLRYVFFGLGPLCLIWAALAGFSQSARGLPVWTSKPFWAATVGAVLFAVGGWKLKQSAAVNCLLLLGTLVFLEGTLQVAGWLGLLPGVNTKQRCPYGRVYWTREGLGNSIRNSAGWYYPRFNTEARSRIALVGDSMVEAVEIHPSRNQGVLLEKHLRAAGRDAGVIALGNHGTSVAYHREVINYAARHFRPEEVVLYLSIVNDIADCSAVLNGVPPAFYIYYEAKEDGRLEINPASLVPREQVRRNLEFSHLPAIQTLAVTLSSHVMVVQVMRGVRDGWLSRQVRQGIAALAGQEQEAVGKSLREAGVHPLPFRMPPDPEGEKAMAVLLGNISACKVICEKEGMRLKLVTVPTFPQVFYATQKGRDWTQRLGNYDFQAPERRIAAFAASNSLPVLELGQYMKSRNLDVSEVQRLYLSNGSGHLSEAGHAFCATAVFETFYRDHQTLNAGGSASP